MRRSVIVGCLALSSVAVLGGCGDRADEAAQARAPAPLPAQRASVLAADVLMIDGRHIRLAGAYPPQGIPDARCWAEALAAKQAAESVRRLIRDSTSLTVEPTGRTDPFNRAIAHVVLDGVDLALTLHDDGVAAKISEGRFAWCEPISKGGAGAPTMKSLLDLGS